MNKKSKNKSLPPTTTDKEIFELLEKAQEQYRVYREINDVAKIALKPKARPVVIPSPKNPLTSSITHPVGTLKNA